MNNHTGMKQIKMNTRLNTHQEMIFEKAFDEFILFCKGNNYRKATIEHYTFSYNQIIKFIPYNTPISKINKETYDNFLLYLNELNLSDQTVLTYSRDFKRIVNYFIKNEYIPNFIMKLPKVDKKAIECYTDEEIKSLIRKPNTNKFTDYRNYVIVNFILSTGLRLSSLTNIRIKDIDLNDCIVTVMHTKNRKPLLIPLNNNIVKILKEYLKYRQSNNDADFLFCTAYGKQLTRITIGNALRKYNSDKKITTTGIHRLRHTFAKKWILGGNSVVALQKILGHSSLEMTQRYINVLITDLDKEVNRYNILQEFSDSYIKLRK